MRKPMRKKRNKATEKEKRDKENQKKAKET